MRAGENLVFMEDARKAIALGIASRRNVVEWGPGGHAKSKLVTQVFDELEDQGVSTHIQTLSVDTNVMDLFGGLHPDYVKQHIYDRPRVEDSWIVNADVVCFEEGFDAPPRVLAALKDLLMSRTWRYGNTEIPLRPRCVIILTNHKPSDIADLDPSVSALVERFPISVHVRWNNYHMDSFQAMFKRLEGQTSPNGEFMIPSWDEMVNLDHAPFAEDDYEYLSAVFGTAAEMGVKTAPRTAVFAKEVISAWAALDGHSEIKHEHFDILELLSDIGEAYQEIKERASRQRIVHEERLILTAAAQEVRDLADELEQISDDRPEDPTKEDKKRALSVAKKMTNIESDLKSREKDGGWQDETVDIYKRILNLCESTRKGALEYADLYEEE